MRAGVFFQHIVSAFDWAWMDITCKYRRSVIGPFWETINIFLMIMGISYMSSVILNIPPLSNIAYVGLGMIAWSALTGLITEGTGVFITNKDYIRNSPLTIDLYVMRTIFRVLITSCHHLLLYIIALAFLPIPLHMGNLMGILGLFFLFINALWVVPTIGFLCARFRDLEMIIRNLLQLTFFVTPIFWDYRTVHSERSFIVQYNPFFYFLEAIRAPLLGETLPMLHYAIILAITLGGYALLWIVYRMMRRNLAFFV